MLNFCDFIQVFVFTTIHHLKVLLRLQSIHNDVASGLGVFTHFYQYDVVKF